MTTKHTIHQLVFEIEGFKNNSQYQTIASKISLIVRSSLESAIDRILNEYNVEGYHIMIESLELDLGHINIYNLSYNLPRLIRKELRKHINVIQKKAKYDIKHNKASSLNYIQNKNQSLSTVLSAKQIETPYELSKDPTHYFQNISHQKVVPEDARYFDAVVHYLEYGWLPRYLDIPMLEFDEILVDTLEIYGEEIVKHFGRKPASQKEKISERIIRQTAGNKKLKKSKKATKTVLKSITSKNVDENIQAFIKYLDYVASSSKSITKAQKKELQEWSESLTESTQILQKISGLTEEKTEKSKEEKAKLDSQDSTKPTKVAGINSASFNPFERLNEHIKKILDSNDKSLFNSILETKFYKSLVQGYESKIDSSNIIVRTLAPLVLEPEKSDVIFQRAPEFFDSENELINQLYSKSPYLVKQFFSELIAKNTSPSQLIKQINTLFSKLSKKHVNNILQSYFSYYNKLSVQLNTINSVFPKENYSRFFLETINDLTKNNLNYVDLPNEQNKYSHIQLMSLILLSKDTPQKVMTDYINAVHAFLKKEKVEAKLLLDSKIGERKYTKTEEAEKFIIESLEREQNLLEEDTKEISLYILNTLLKDLYLPTKYKTKKTLESSEVKKLIEKTQEENQVKSSDEEQEKDEKALGLTQKPTELSQQDLSKQLKIKSAKEIDSLINNLVKFKVKKTKIQEAFKSYNVLKNPVLAKLPRQTFFDLLNITLSTSEARLFKKLFEKYEQMFKVHVSVDQIQLIFLSLMKNHKEINENNIFHYYFEELKNLKGWTYDVHKKYLVALYEKFSENLLTEEKEEFIKYVDSIPTYLGLELRDTKKKLEEGIPIKNAGLCLLWPFFKTLFSICEYLSPKGDFKNKEMRERATLLLQYLAVKSSAIEEPYLALNKIFTGLPLEESLPSEIILTKKEKDIADALLLNVIKQWPSFNNSSPDNLRGSFIIRDGVLFFRGKQWVLRVESKAYDILLKKLPWGFSMIRLSWIPYIIKVEWN